MSFRETRHRTLDFACKNPADAEILNSNLEMKREVKHFIDGVLLKHCRTERDMLHLKMQQIPKNGAIGTLMVGT